MAFHLIYKAYGSHAILIEWPQKIDKAILYDILAFKEKIKTVYDLRIVSLNHAYNSILLVLSGDNFNFYDEKKALENLYSNVKVAKSKMRRLWKIPVCYDPYFGIDLDMLSQEKNLSIDEIIKLHTAPDYTIYFTGFLPGFLYLGGLNALLHSPRRATPRLYVEKGAVAIGGMQTGIYPLKSPGGWQIIGNSPISFFNIGNKNPCFADAGDALKFYPVTLKRYNDIKTLVEADVYQIENQHIDD